MRPAEHVVDQALALLGMRYELGGQGVRSIDCSALMQRVFRSVGLRLPRTAREQLRHGAPIALTELRAGDLLFYRWQPRQLHVALYVDDDTIVHASPKQGQVVMTRLTPSWRSRFVAARRVM